MADRSIEVRMTADISNYESKMKAAGKATQEVGKAAVDSSSKTSDWIRRNEQSINELSNKLAIVGAGMVAAAGFAVKSAMDWQSAWTGVTKTVDGTGEQMAKLEADLRDLAKTAPFAHAEIAGVAEAAGQLGIQTDNVAGFTQTMLDMGIATNMSAEEAAVGMARFMNVMGTAQTDADKLGSVIVDLGNNFATTEREILDMAQNLAGAGRVVGMSESNVLALSAALSSVGVEAEAGGSAVSRVMIKVSQAVDEGGASLQQFADAAGMSSSEFAKAWKADPVNALLAVISGLAKMTETGSGTFAMLDELGMSDVRVTRAMLGLSNAVDLTKDAVTSANVAWEQNTALADEAAKFYDKAESRIKMAWNSIKDAAIDFGTEALPVVSTFADAVSGLAQKFGELPQPIKTALLVLVGGGGLLALAGAGVGKLVVAVNNAKIAFAALGLSAKTASLSMGAIGLVLTAGTLLLGNWAKKSAEAKQQTTEFKDSLDQATGAVTENTRALIANRLEEDGIAKAYKELGGSLADLVPAIEGDAAAIARVNAVLDQNTEKVSRGGTAYGDIIEVYTAGAQKVADSVKENASSLQDASDAWSRENEMVAAGAAEQTNVAAATTASTAAIEANTEATEASAEAYEDFLGMALDASAGFMGLASIYDAAIQKNVEWAKAQADATSTAEDSWEDFYDGQSVSSEQYIAQLQAQVEAQKNWQQNMLDLAHRVNTGMTDEMRQAANAMITELMDLGPEGAAQVALLKSMSDEELAQVVELYGLKGQASGLEWSAQMAAEMDMHPPTADVEVNTADANAELAKFYANASRTVTAKVVLNSQNAEAEYRRSMGAGATGGMVSEIASRTQGFARGGILPGRTPFDRLRDNLWGLVDNRTPVLLRSGEHVSTTASARRNAAALAAGNRGATLGVVPGYAAGGFMPGAVFPVSQQVSSATKTVAPSINIYVQGRDLATPAALAQLEKTVTRGASAAMQMGAGW